MKKHVCLLLCCILFLVTAAVSADAGVTEAQKTLAKEGAEAFLDLVNSYYSGNIYLEEGHTDLRIWCPDGPAFAQDDPNSPFARTYYKVKMQETAGVGFHVESIVTYTITPWNDIIPHEITADILRDGPVYIDPYGSFSYNAGCPADGNMRYEVIVVAGTDDNGHAGEFYGIAERLNVFPAAQGTVAADETRDTQNLRYRADYEVEVADGVWWVPVRSLGESRYTNHEIAQMVTGKPEEKKAAFATLYEALQLFQIGNFCNGDDNIRLMENGIDWEHHKPGYEAVRTNTGCCATDSNWLNYILKDDYVQVGFLAYSQLDGSGHILNYIFHDGYYYFIDLTHFRTDFLDSSAPETGNVSDYRNSDFVAGSLHKASSPEAYISYCIRSFNEPPALFFLYRAPDCYPVTGMPVNGKMAIIYPEGRDITVLPGKDAAMLDVVYSPYPQKKASWDSVPDAVFHVEDRYLAGTAEPASPSEPLSVYKQGDTLSLEDYGNQGFAVIDGKDFAVSSFQQRTQFAFENYVNMYGGNNLSFFDYEFPVSMHEKKIAEMESLVLGDLMLSFNRKYSQTQLVFCVREGNTLKVEEVKDNPAPMVIPVSIRKDEQGNWQACPEYWGLFLYRDETGKTEYEFGRLGVRITR